jgi:hypothetical protein
LPEGLADVKRVRNGHPRAFVAACARYGWHWQANWYLRAARANDLAADWWSWIVVERGGPTVIYTVPASELARVDAAIDAALALYRRCAEADNWPGYESGPLDLSYLVTGPEIDTEDLEVETEEG